MAGGIDEIEDPIGDMLRHRDAPRLFESGTQNLAVVSVLTDAVAWMDTLGWAWIEERERALAGYLRAALRTLPGVHVLTPDAWERSSAITTFSIEGVEALHIQPRSGRSESSPATCPSSTRSASRPPTSPARRSWIG